MSFPAETRHIVPQICFVPRVGTPCAFFGWREAVPRPKGVFLVMSGRFSSNVIVVKFDDEMLSGLSRCVLRHRWTVLDGRAERSLVKEIVCSQVSLLLLQVPKDHAPALDLLGRLRRLWRPLTTVAVSSDESEETETCLRRAGVSAYLGPASSQDAIDRLLAQLAVGSVAGGSQVEIKVAKINGRKAK